MNQSRLPWLILAAPLLLSACGSGADDPVQTRQSSELGSSGRAASMTVPPTTAVLRGLRENFAIERTDTGYSVTDLRSGAVVSAAVGTRLRFDDTSTALDLEGVPGKAYRLYRAAFGRIPDVAGLSYWIETMDAGTPLATVAGGFVEAAEFKSVYGAKPANLELVSRMYLHVLGRSGEAAGIEYWTGLLDKKAITSAELLVGFSESAESKTGTAAGAGKGIDYHEPGYFYGVLATNEFRYRTLATPNSAAEARVRWNEQGARGYALSRNVGYQFSGRSDSWNIDLFSVHKPRATYTYEVRAASAKWPERLALFEELGAKGYLYKSNRRFPGNLDQSYDVFVKSSEVDTTYRYQFEPTNYSTSSLNEHGAKGFAYIDILADSYVLYAKDMKSDAVYEYVQAELKKFGDGAVEQLNEMGARSFAFLGSRRAPGMTDGLFMRSSAYGGTFSYLTEPAIHNSAQEMSVSLTKHGLQGEAYQGNYFQPVAPIGMVTLYSKGGWINHEHLGPTFP